MNFPTSQKERRLLRMKIQTDAAEIAKSRALELRMTYTCWIRPGEKHPSCIGGSMCLCDCHDKE